MAFQFWVLGMSVVAILNESIPHIAASLLTHVLATIWSAYQMFNTASFQEEFVRSTIRSGLCNGVNLLPGYWKERRAAEIAVLVVNCVSLVVFVFLSWRLIKVCSTISHIDIFDSDIRVDIRMADLQAHWRLSPREPSLQNCAHILHWAPVDVVLHQ